MARFSSTPLVLALVAVPALIFAGCSVVTPLLEDALPQVDDQAFDLLRQTVSPDELAEAQLGGQTPSAADESVGSAEEETSLAEEQTDAAEEETSLNEVPFEAIELDEDAIFPEVVVPGGGPPVAHGGLAGRFGNDLPGHSSDTSSGIFHGRWFTADGNVCGEVRGEYRPQPPEELPDGIAGGGIFHGRYTDLEGRFRGFLRGRYGHRAGERGFFFGHWLDHRERLIGVLKGHWEDDPEVDGGTFRGRWAAFDICDEADSLLESDSDDFESDLMSGPDDPLLTDADLGLADQIDLTAVQDLELTDEIDLLLAAGVSCIDPDRPHGFLRGWHLPLPPDDPDTPGPPRGVFSGRWFTADRDPTGRLLGSYVERARAPADRPSVRGRFHGRYLDRAGRIRGTIRGIYGVSTHGLGVFRGRHFDSDDEPLGILRGRWDDAPDRRGGPFFGFWVGVDFGAPKPGSDGNDLGGS